MAKMTTVSKLKAGNTYRAMGPFGNEPGPVRTLERIQPAVARGYYVLTFTDGTTYSCQGSNKVEVLA